MEFDSVEVSQDKKTATFKYKIFLINLYEPIFETTTLSIDITLQNVEWEDDIQNLQRTQTNLQEKNKQPHQKVGKGYEQTFLKRRHAYSQQTHEKMLTITGHQRNANQNHNEIPSHTS